MARRYATPSEYIQVHEKLKDIIDVQENGYCTYHAGWTDKKVHEELNVTDSVVKRVRTDMFGKLKAPKGELSPKSTIETRITHLEKKIARLEQFMNENFQTEYEATKS